MAAFHALLLALIALVFGHQAAANQAHAGHHHTGVHSFDDIGPGSPGHG